MKVEIPCTSVRSTAVKNHLCLLCLTQSLLDMTPTAKLQTLSPWHVRLIVRSLENQTRHAFSGVACQLVLYVKLCLPLEHDLCCCQTPAIMPYGHTPCAGVCEAEVEGLAGVKEGCEDDVEFVEVSWRRESSQEQVACVHAYALTCMLKQRLEWQCYYL